MAWFLYCIIYYNFCTVLYAFMKYVRNEKLKKKKPKYNKKHCVNDYCLQTALC